MPRGLLADPYLGKFELISLAVGLGLLIGLERERAGKDAGLRTFSLTALAGALTALISTQFALITLGFVTVLVAVLNLGAVYSWVRGTASPRWQSPL